MLGFLQTNGERGEILVERSGNFVGFIINLGRPDLWAAYDRRLKLIGKEYGSRGQAGMACYFECVGEKKIPIGDVLVLGAE